MRRFVPFAVGTALGFAGMLLALAAGVLFLMGIGGGILVRERPGATGNMNFDPSDVVALSAVVGAAAAAVALGFAATMAWLRK